MGDADISVTKLIDAPQIRRLREKHKAEIKPDARREVAKLLGKAWHSYMEKFTSPGTLAEERLFATVGGKILSGAMDLQIEGAADKVRIRDWKCWKVSELQYDHAQAEAQLNCYAYLCRVNGKDPVDLAVYALLKDWQEGFAFRDRSYPTSPVITIPLRLWTPEEAESYVSFRMALHFDNTVPPDCSKAERWVRGESWALFKAGGKRASAVFENRAEAITAWKKAAPGFYIQHRPGDAIRCQRDWCEVSRFCPQYLKHLEPTDEINLEEAA